MWMVLLYGVATFMETGVGVWMFGRMFPERNQFRIQMGKNDTFNALDFDNIYYA